MKKIIISLVIFSGLMLSCITYAQSSGNNSNSNNSNSNGCEREKMSFCEVWACENRDNSNAINGKVCTDLVEGIPMNMTGQDKELECVSMQANANANMCYAVVSKSGLGAINSYVAVIYRYASWTIGILAVLVVIIGGLMIAVGGASPESVTKGRKYITWAIIGVILFFLIGVILRTINPNFFT